MSELAQETSAWPLDVSTMRHRDTAPCNASSDGRSPCPSRPARRRTRIAAPRGCACTSRTLRHPAVAIARLLLRLTAGRCALVRDPNEQPQANLESDRSWGDR